MPHHHEHLEGITSEAEEAVEEDEVQEETTLWKELQIILGMKVVRQGEAEEATEGRGEEAPAH